MRRISSITAATAAFPLASSSDQRVTLTRVPMMSCSSECQSAIAGRESNRQNSFSNLRTTHSGGENGLDYRATLDQLPSRLPQNESRSSNGTGRMYLSRQRTHHLPG